MKRLKCVAVFSSIHHFNNSSVHVLACMYCSFSFHYFFWKNLFFVFFMFFLANPAIWNPAKQWNQNCFGSICFGRTWKNLRLNRPTLRLASHLVSYVLTLLRTYSIFASNSHTSIHLTINMASIIPNHTSIMAIK